MKALTSSSTGGTWQSCAEAQGCLGQGPAFFLYIISSFLCAQGFLCVPLYMEVCMSHTACAHARKFCPIQILQERLVTASVTQSDTCHSCVLQRQHCIFTELVALSKVQKFSVGDCYLRLHWVFEIFSHNIQKIGCGEKTLLFILKKKKKKEKKGFLERREEKAIQMNVKTKDKWKCYRSLPKTWGWLTLLFPRNYKGSLKFAMCSDRVRRTAEQSSRK